MKRIVVTGANRGMSLAIVKKFLQDYPDTYLLLGSRDEGRGKEAMAEVGDNVKDRVELMIIDVTSDESVSKAVNSIKTNHGAFEPLYGLVNNAGGLGDSSKTARGTIDLNMYGLKRVTEAFLPIIQKNKGRIVQISSDAAPMFVAKCSSKIQEFLVDKDVTWQKIEKTIIAPYLEIDENDDLDADKKSSALSDIGLSKNGMTAYGLSKACVNAYTLELAKRFPSMLINSCCPGFIDTDLTKPWTGNSGKTAAEMGLLPVEKGTIVADYLMMEDLLATNEGYKSGRYYESDGKWSPFHKPRSPYQDPPYDGVFP